MEPTIGRTVIYKLSVRDAEAINRRRTTGQAVANRMSKNEASVTHWPQGAQAHIGVPVTQDEEYPMIIVRVWGVEDVVVNGQVLLDGNDNLWVTSVPEGNENGQWHWPTRTIETTAEEPEMPTAHGAAVVTDTPSDEPNKRADSGGHKKRRG